MPPTSTTHRPLHQCRRSAAFSPANLLTIIITTEKRLISNKMCKIWSLTYTCEHTHDTKLSKCLGNITYRHRTSSLSTASPSPEQLKEACNGTSPTLKFKVDHYCGPCSRQNPERELVNKLEGIILRYPVPDHMRRLEAEEEYQREIFELHRRFPGVYKRACSQKGQALRDTPAVNEKQRRESSLREEVFPEQFDDSMDQYLEEWATNTWRQDEDEEWKPVHQEGPASIRMSWATAEWD